MTHSIQSKVEDKIVSSWFGERLIWLLPLALVFFLVSTTRRWLYTIGCLPRYRSSVPVVVVGNILVGGAGKSPLTIHLVNRFKEKGIQVGVVSRGYGVDFTGAKTKLVDTNADPSDVGDEPLMIARQTGVNVCIGRDRSEAIKRLEDLGCTVIVADDGLQHYRMKRDIEICVVDSQRGHGNGYCLPAGPLRELPRRLRLVDFVVVRESSDEQDNSVSRFRDFDQYQTISMTTEPLTIRPLKEVGASLSAPGKACKVRAIAGIAHPERFFDTLREMGFDVEEHPFPDHHQFVRDDLDFKDELPVLMTEKDAVKCASFDIDNAWVLNISVKLDSDLVGLLTRALETKGWNLG